MKKIVSLLILAFSVSVLQATENNDMPKCCSSAKEIVSMVQLPMIQVPVSGLNNETVLNLSSSLNFSDPERKIEEKEMKEIEGVIRSALKDLSFQQFQNPKIKEEVSAMIKKELSKHFEGDELKEVIIDKLVVKTS